MQERSNLQSDSASWVKIRDFVQTSYRIHVSNVTTNMPLKTSMSPEISELMESGLVMRLPRTAGSLGHLLLVRIQQKKIPELANQPLIDLTVTGKVVDLVPFTRELSIFTIQFYQFEEMQWKNLLQECKTRQAAVDALMRKIQD